MATPPVAPEAQQRRALLRATQRADTADPNDSEPLPALAAVPGLVGGGAAPRGAAQATSQGGEAVASGGAAAAAAAAAAAVASTGTGTRSGRSDGLRDAKVQEWLLLANRSRMGPRLQELRDTHRRQSLPIEKYGLAHVYKLGTARQTWTPEPREWCKDIHRKRDRDGRSIRCTQCTTCHWCRQKSPQIKTQCSACHANKDNVYGGPYAGVICGNCLWTRFGENLHEVQQDQNWLCPACRQICNCSANNCVRAKNGWVPTNQLISEAESLGYDSVAHYLVLSQLDESLLTEITDNVHSLQPLLDREVARRVDAAKRQRNERDATTGLRSAAENLVDREMAVIRAATGLSDERVTAVAARNQQLLAALGFGQGTLAADLMDDDDEDDELLPSPAAARAGSVAPAASALGPAGSRESPAAGSPDLQQVQRASPGAPGLTQLSAGLAAGSSSLGVPGVARRRLPPRRPGTPSPWAVAATTNAAAAAAGGAGPAAAPAAGPWALPAGEAVQAGPQLGPLAAGAPAAAAAAVAPSGSSGLLGAAGGLSTAAAPADAAEGTDGTGVAAGGASAAEPGRQEQLDGLLHRDAHAAFPAGLPDDGMVPGQALGHRPASSAAARSMQRQACAPGSLPAGLPRPPLRPHMQQQQARLTPVAAPGSKQARAASVEPGAGGRLAAGGQQAAEQMGAEALEVRARSSSPMEIVEPSQQLGLSPGAAELQAAAAQQAGASPATAAADAAVAAVAVTPAPGAAAGAEEAPAPKKQLSGPAANWHFRRSSALQLAHEMAVADPEDPNYAGPSDLNTEEGRQEAENRYSPVYERNMKDLKDVLEEANRALAEPLVVIRVDDVSNRPNSIPLDALHEMVELYNFLATALPDEDVWQPVERLLCKDCFLDIGRSHWSARFVLLEAWIYLRRTLLERGLGEQLRPVYPAISDLVASMAEDGTRLRRLLGQIQQGLTGSVMLRLPEQDLQIGPYHYDASERARGLREVCTQLQKMCGVIDQLLYESLELCQGLAADLKFDAMKLISQRLVAALLGSDRGLPHRLKQAGAELIFFALNFSSLQEERRLGQQLSVVEINRRREQRLRMCQVVKEVLPLLEEVVAADYPLWRPAGAPAGALRPDALAALSTGAASGPAFRQTLGQRGVNVLMRAYAFLMECGQMSWQQLEEKAIQPYNSPATFWQLANRVYRVFGMSLVADTLQHVSNLSLPDPRARTWLLRHWLLCLTDRSRKFNSAERLTLVLSQVQEMKGLFAGLDAAQLAIGADGLGKQTAVVLQHVVRALVRDFSWRPHLPELLQGLDELLERRDKEAAGTDARTRNARLRYNARLYRLLAAVLLAATPLMPLPPAIAPPGLGLASTVDQLRRLAQRMAMLVVGSCLAVQREYAAQRARAAAGRVGLAVLDVEDDLGSALRSLGDVRQRLQGLPFGQLSVLWQVLLAWGAPAACQSTQQLLKPVVAVVGCALELCSGEKEASPFDQAVLERLADSLLALPEDQSAALRQANPGAASLAQLREFVLGTLLRRYVGRCHVDTDSAQRSAVNAVRLLELVLRSLRGEEEVQGALLPLLWSLLDALRPRNATDKPSIGTQEAIFSMLARLLEHNGPLAQLLPPLTDPAPGAGRAAVVSRAMHSFWTAAASDALLCCSQAVWQHLAEPKRLQYRAKLQADRPPRLLPRDMDPAANAAVNTVSGLCGRLAQQWTVNIEGLCTELSKQLELMRREAAAAPSAAAATMPPPAAMFRPADFGWTLAHSTLHLFTAFLHAHLDSGEAAEQQSPGPAGAVAGADGSPAAAGGPAAAAGVAAVAAAGGAPAAPAAAAAAAAARAQRWQDLLPGQQWAFACLFAPARLILVSGKLGKPLQDAYMRFQLEVQAAVGPLMPKGLCLASKSAAGITCMGGNTVVGGGPAATPQRRQQLPPPPHQQQQQQQGDGAVALPAASGICASAAPGQSAKRQRVEVKEEPLSQPAGPTATQQQSQQPPAALGQRQQSQQPPAALGQRQQAQRLDRDMSFAELEQLPRHSLLQVVGYLRRKPSVKDVKTGRVLQLDLRDHKRRRLALLVQQRDEPQLFEQLLAEATRRFDRQPNGLHMLRASNAMLLEQKPGGSAAAGESLPAASSSGHGSGGSSGSGQHSCVLKTGRHVPSVGWDPTGERAAKIRQAVADGLVQLGDQQAGPQPVLATQATVVQPSVHRPETQVTPAMHWTPQLRAAAGSPGATQVADAGGVAGGAVGRPVGSVVPATQAEMSQAPAAAAAQRRPAAAAGAAAAQRRPAGAAGAAVPTAPTAGSMSAWQQLALDVAALLAPHGLSRMDSIAEVRKYTGEKDSWVARGAHALAAEICRQLGKPRPP